MKLPPRAQLGFTLVEMLVSLLIFGIIATVATALTMGATRSFAATDTALASLSNLEATRAVLAADLGQAAQRPSLAADGAPMPAFVLTPDGFVFVRRREGTLPALEKVSWGLVDGQLVRQPFPTIDRSPPGQPVAMIEGISAIRLRVATEQGWQDGWQPQDPEDLPRAVEMTLLRADGVPIILKFLVAA
ncbi:type II secretion system protein GspJ [Sandaracinobacteroides hominis]|uniref:type II secretion system protein GspJ n=1 Tax=Sandaracinobacteroides hominis TaxID=2780086 RepID=UPI0018F7A6DE|nr:type II secretion system protein GspJ [Sandaracinobacteroides hominis]